MARIRSIKPEFWSSEQVMACSPTARLLFIGIWNFADDAGRMKLAPRTIKAQVFPGDDISAERVRGMIDELSSNGLLDVYAVDSVEYFKVTGWQHQKIDKPQKPKHPDKPSDYSPSTQRMVATDLTDLNGGEGKGEENAAPVGAHPPFEPPQTPTPEAELYRRGKELLGEKAGGVIKKLITAKGGNIALARSAIETASTKQDAREYIGAIIRGRDSPSELRLSGEAW